MNAFTVTWAPDAHRNLAELYRLNPAIRREIDFRCRWCKTSNTLVPSLTWQRSPLYSGHRLHLTSTRKTLTC